MIAIECLTKSALGLALIVPFAALTAQDTLPPMQIRATTACVAPGPPVPSADPVAAQLLERFLAASRIALARDTMPMTRWYAHRSESVTRFGTVAPFGEARRWIRTPPEWPYAPGRLERRPTGEEFARSFLSILISQQKPIEGFDAFRIQLPMLAQLSSVAFVESHCFRTRKATSRDPAGLLQLEVTTARRVPTPDLDGVLYIDPVTHHLRESLLWLSRIPGQLGEIERVEFRTFFAADTNGYVAIESIEIVQQNRTPRSLDGIEYMRWFYKRIPTPGPGSIGQAGNLSAPR